MIVITELYRLLFGRSSLQNGDVINMAEHGRAGGVSTGTPFKTTRKVEEKTIIDDASATITYVGKAPQGGLTSDAAWQIKRITVSGTTTTIEYADSDDNYDNIWDSRSSLTYG